MLFKPSLNPIFLNCNLDIEYKNCEKRSNKNNKRIDLFIYFNKLVLKIGRLVQHVKIVF